MDKEWPEEERTRFIEAAAQHPELRGIHDFRTRRSGSHDFAQFHMYVAPDMTVAEAHVVMDAVEAKIRQAIPKVEVLIHLDPEGHVDTDNPLIEADVTPHWFEEAPMRIPFVQIDAFAGQPFEGNPAAVMPLAAWLDDATLQAIAAENNLAETAFILPDESGAADFELRWFTADGRSGAVRPCDAGERAFRAVERPVDRLRAVPHPQGRRARSDARGRRL